MSTFREKAQGRTKQMVGQMIGDELLVEEGKDQERKAEQEAEATDDGSEHRTAREARPQPDVRNDEQATNTRPNKVALRKGVNRRAAS
jgi:uncharacterized protein YjbJ (UPF0337 family)